MKPFTEFDLDREKKPNEVSNAEWERMKSLDEAQMSNEMAEPEEEDVQGQD